ncbi:DUF3606 domain-containing protein [Mucilaginibacter sp. BT774]|uniref:DUF3606 domain-containing protein n=1 Tax=Mucilaginibacter sp. BT774 TaxID=3062276 RepID=UPI0026744100|nr:DUF3606 domain-containing protein [Mucilaginibacter sp. BT774]MDO3627633.1 DUF3606 domain-containing protein [Mucilaginibacter sp. BT774]
MDNQQQAAIPDQQTIDNGDDVELRIWADKFGVTKVKLKAAINAVGPSAKVVEAYLNRKK